MKLQKVAVCMFLTALLPLGVFGCGHPRSPAELEAGLDSPDPVQRRSAADGLRSREGVSAEALPKLYAAIDKEQDQEAYGAELITLGASGDAKALPYICKNVGGGADGDVRMSRWANHALQAWEKKNPGSNGCKGASTVTPEAPKNQPTAPAGDTRSM
ncbi:MAG: HEAT repeat domain-containing protein [Polyangiaceae bacterium]